MTCTCQQKQVQVSVFYHEHVPGPYRRKFMDLMKEWDGGNDVWYAFYDLDILHMKLKEAKEFF